MSSLAIKDVADRTGIAAGTIRMWEQRYGFPDPHRTASGYRRYTEDHVAALRKVVAYRERGLSVTASIARARERAVSDHPSIYAAVAETDHGAHPQVLARRTLVALSLAIEHEALARAAAPVLFASFQREAFYRQVEERYRRLAASAVASAVFADFPALRRPDGGPVEIPVAEGEQLRNEWAVVVDAPGFSATLLAWELPGERGPGGDPRRFETLWTLSPRATRRAAECAAQLAARADPVLGAGLESLLAERPMAIEEPNRGLTALTNRLLGYLERR